MPGSSAAAGGAVAETALAAGSPVATVPLSSTGNVRAALAFGDFRRLWAATFASSIGTWMQNVALGAYVYTLSGSAFFVALVGFVQMGPTLVLAPVGGLLADLLDRRRLLVVTYLLQLGFSVALAVVALDPQPSRGLLLGVVLGIGVAHSLSGPVLASLLPTLVPRAQLPGAVSLQSFQMNMARVLGPALGGLLLPVVHATGVFALNALTYLFAVAGVLGLRVTSRRAAITDGERLPHRLLGGFRIARTDPVVRTVLVTITSIAFFCLPFIGLMPVLAAENLGLDVTGPAYGALYASFGLGAATGALCVGSLFVGQRPDLIVRTALATFAVLLAILALLRQPAGAYPVVFLVGAAYFSTVTSLSTRLQEHLDDGVRGRVLALYMMGFGGTVPLGLLAGGALVPYLSVTGVVLGGAVAAGLLALTVPLERLQRETHR